MAKKQQTNAANETDLDTKDPGPVKPKIMYRDEIQVDHHLFKGAVAKCLRSDKWGPIKIKQIEHVHFFHTVNSNGTPQKYSNQVAGHLHEWSHGVDEEGNLVAKCGPPLKKVVRPGPNGINKISYDKIQVKDVDTGEFYQDNHVHEMQYLGSDKINQAKVQAIQRSNAAQIGGPGNIKVHQEPPKVDGFAMSDADRAKD
jgi:hypothetical protein